MKSVQFSRSINLNCWWSLFIMVFGDLTFSGVFTVGPHCECIQFVDTYSKEYGVFTSPNWPTPYEDDTHCILYTFMAKSDQIIEINFDEFDLQRNNVACIYGDYVRLYLHINETAINERTAYNQILCGKIADIEQTHYSAGSSLVLEFRSDWRSSNSTGFRGTFRFLDKKLFHTDGQLLKEDSCDYLIESLPTDDRPTDSSSVERATRGRFFSPLYPSTYPRNTKCSYIFRGQSNEQVKLVFESIRLEKSDSSCLDSSDVISVHDGSNESYPIIGLLCNTNTFVELVSTGPELLIHFQSTSRSPGQGFKGRFYFEPTLSSPNLLDIPSTEPQKSKELIPNAYSLSSENVDCNYVFESDVAKNGTFSSPDYPNLYPPNIKCRYQFKGRGKERVQILFIDFDTFKLKDTPKNCDGADVVMLFVTSNGQKSRLDNLCGSTLPDSALQLMSNGPSMSIEFESYSHSQPHQSRGFKAEYRFVTNFGITTGVQNNNSVCGFDYRSSDSSNGSFMSPNHPGKYPRDTECHYFFYGNRSAHEKVYIKFAYFDVEGVTPCDTETASDYLEFSNYRTVDRKIPRHCGQKNPKDIKIESDGDFFRVTFKSNDRFDGTGFLVYYQFRPPEDNSKGKQIRGLSSVAGSHLLSSILSATVLIWGLFNVIMSDEFCKYLLPRFPL